MLLTERAYAKLNLTLDVLGLRADGYHDLKMVMQTVDLCDDVELTLRDSGAWRISGSGIPMPEDETNLAWRAAEAYFSGSGLHPGLTIRIHKRIPVQAGMAGGSADAAAVLRALNGHYALYSAQQLHEIALSVGSDVPYCLVGGTKLAEGRGELLSPLPPMPDCYVLIAKPDCAISTPELFRGIDREHDLARPATEQMLAALQHGGIREVGKNLCNVFEPLAMKKHGEIVTLLTALRNLSKLGAAMTGTGSACFALFSEKTDAEAAQEQLAKDHSVFLAKPV